MEPTSPRLQQKNASARVGHSYSNLKRKHHHIISIISHQSKGAITVHQFGIANGCKCFVLWSLNFSHRRSLLPKSFCLAVVPQGTHPVKLQSGGCHGATAARNRVKVQPQNQGKNMENISIAKTFPMVRHPKKYKQSSTSFPWYCPVLSEFHTGDSWKFAAPKREQTQHEFSAAPNESNPGKSCCRFCSSQWILSSPSTPWRPGGRWCFEGGDP